VDVTGRDDTLILLFMCCHAALNRPALALTLRAVAPDSAAEIANAFLCGRIPTISRGDQPREAGAARLSPRGAFVMPEGE